MPIREYPEKRKAYLKTYRETHKEEISVLGKAWYKANKEKKLADSKAYREANPELYKIWNKAWYQANKEKKQADSKGRYKANREKIRAQHKANYETHKEEYFVRSAKRKALKIQAMLPTTDDELIKNLYELRKFTTEGYGEQYHVDHIIPLSIGGAHHQDNMRVITAKENLEKKDKYIPELGGVWADNDLAREYKKKHNIE